MYLSHNDTSFQSPFIFEDQFKFEKIIGKGAFGEVIAAKDKFTDEEVAIKIISKNNVPSDDICKLRKEAQILSSLDHPNIVQYRNVYETDEKIYLVMEYLRGGSLAQMMQDKKNKGGKFGDILASRIVGYILKSVQYIHSKEIAHRDIKPENILFAHKNDYRSLKLVDFGLSDKYRSISIYQFHNKCGTMLYMAPEIVSKQPYSKSVDIFAIGIIMYLLISGGEHPLYSKNEKKADYIEKLKNPVWNFDHQYSKLAKSLFLKLVNSDPSERYSAEQALRHPWITRVQTEIPITIMEKLERCAAGDKFQSLVLAMLFSIYTRQKNYGKIRSISPKYKKKISKVSDCVISWYNQVESSPKKAIKNDDDYYSQIEHSPTKFSFSDNEDDENETSREAEDTSPTFRMNKDDSTSMFHLKNCLDPDPTTDNATDSTHLNMSTTVSNYDQDKKALNSSIVEKGKQSQLGSKAFLNRKSSITSKPEKWTNLEPNPSMLIKKMERKLSKEKGLNRVTMTSYPKKRQKTSNIPSVDISDSFVNQTDWRILSKNRTVFHNQISKTKVEYGENSIHEKTKYRQIKDQKHNFSFDYSSEASSQSPNIHAQSLRLQGYGSPTKLSNFTNDKEKKKSQKAFKIFHTEYPTTKPRLLSDPPYLSGEQNARPVLHSAHHSRGPHSQFSTKYPSANPQSRISDPTDIKARFTAIPGPRIKPCPYIKDPKRKSVIGKKSEDFGNSSQLYQKPLIPSIGKTNSKYEGAKYINCFSPPLETIQRRTAIGVGAPFNRKIERTIKEILKANGINDIQTNQYHRYNILTNQIKGKSKKPKLQNPNHSCVSKRRDHSTENSTSLLDISSLKGSTTIKGDNIGVQSTKAKGKIEYS